MVDFDYEGDLVGGTPRHRPRTPKRGGHRVAAALDRSLTIFSPGRRVRVWERRRPGRVLDALVHRQDGRYPVPARRARAEQGLEVANDGDGPVEGIHTRSTKSGPGRGRREAGTLALVSQQIFGVLCREARYFLASLDNLLVLEARLEARGWKNLSSRLFTSL